MSSVSSGVGGVRSDPRMHYVKVMLPTNKGGSGIQKMGKLKQDGRQIIRVACLHTPLFIWSHFSARLLTKQV